MHAGKTRVAAAAVGLAAALVLAGTGGVAAAATDAASPHHVYNTGGQGLWLHPGAPTLTSALSDLMADGAEFDISCWQYGDNVNGDVVWDYGTDTVTGHTGFAADFYLDTDVTQGSEAAQLTRQGIFQCGTPTSTSPNSGSGSSTATPVRYDRAAAVQWATDHANDKPSFGKGDCTWFASQVLWAGGLPTSDDWTGKTWDWNKIASRLHYPGPTRDAVAANDLVNYLVSQGLATKTRVDWSDNTAGGARLGDLIAYDWDNGTNGTIDHVAVVTKLNDSGYPFVTQHSPARTNRYWSWDPGGDGHSAGWVQTVDQGTGGNQPTAWLIQITY